MKLSTASITGLMALLSRVQGSQAHTPTGFSPSINSSLLVSFEDTKVATGEPVDLNETAISPAVSLDRFSASNTSHVVLMVDIDAPGGRYNNSYSPLLHWLTPVPAGMSHLAVNESAVAPYAPYVGPQPAMGTGPHRYVVVLLENPKPTFEMPQEFLPFNPMVTADRLLFNVTEFVAAGGFKPLAANWFTTENITRVSGGSDSPTSGASSISGGILTAVSLAGSIALMM